MKNYSNNRIRLAIQRSGRLSEASIELLNRCGIAFKKKSEQLFHLCKNFPLDILLVRDDDIPQLVNNGICDFGIIGANVLEEIALSPNLGKTILSEYVQELDFGNCRLSIALPNEMNFQHLTDLNNKRIATSYPNILNNFLIRNNIVADIVTLSGSVEIAPRLGIADAICDLVSTGKTLKANNLREVKSIFSSKAILIMKPTTSAINKATSELFVNQISRSTGVNNTIRSYI